MKVWTTPDSYFGFDPIGDPILYCIHRDSKILEYSNFDCLKIRLNEVASVYPFKEPQNNKYDDGIGPMDWVYEFETSHFAYGWVKWLMLREDAPEELRDTVMSILEDLEERGIFNEDDYYERLYEAKWHYWRYDMGMGERIEACKKAGISIFSARNEEPPEDVDEYFLTDE